MKRSKIKGLQLLTTAASILLSGCALNENTATPGDISDLALSIEKKVDEFQKKHKLAGLSVAVVANGETISEFGRGWADKESQRPIDKNTPMPIGSVTKVITSTAIVQLSRQGLLNINSPISEYLPELKLANGYENQITVAQLCSHHSGLPADIAKGWYNQVSGLEPMRASIKALNGIQLSNEPGRMHAYSNIGYTLLGLIIERVSGKSYDKYLQENIFDPSGMADSIVYPDIDDPRIPRGYSKEGSGPIPLIRDVPAGSVLLSARDGAAFIKALFPLSGEAGIVDPTGQKLLFNPQNSSVLRDGIFSIGLGFWLDKPLNLKVPIAHHGGDLPPFHSFLMTLPEQHSGILVSTNDDSGDMKSLVTELLHILTQWLELNPQKPIPSPKRGWSHGEQEQWVGTYPSQSLNTMKIEKRKKSLVLLLNGTPLHMIPREDNSFTLEYRVIGLPLPINSLKEIRIEMSSLRGEKWLAVWIGDWFHLGNHRRIEDVSYPADFNKYSGKFEPVDHKDKKVIESLFIYDKEDRFFMGEKDAGLPLRYTEDNRAIVDGEGRGLGEELLFTNTPEGMTLHYSGVKLIRVSP